MRSNHLFGRLLAGGALMLCCLFWGCTPPAAAPTTQFVLVGTSFATGDQAAIEANNMIRNAAAGNCRAISVGGYGAAAEGKEIGVIVLVECPQGVTLLPNGQVQ